MIDLHKLPACPHARYEAKTVFVDTKRCALCLTDEIERLAAEVTRLREIERLAKQVIPIVDRDQVSIQALKAAVSKPAEGGK